MIPVFLPPALPPLVFLPLALFSLVLRPQALSLLVLLPLTLPPLVFLPPVLLPLVLLPPVPPPSVFQTVAFHLLFFVLLLVFVHRLFSFPALLDPVVSSTKILCLLPL